MAPLGEERRLLMESHHDGDETKGSVYLLVQDYIEAREASGSVRTAGPKDLTVTIQVVAYLSITVAMLEI